MGGPLALIPLALFGLAVPSIAARRISYAVRGRTDWDVLVYEGAEPDHRPRHAVLHETRATRTEAEGRAETVSAHLLAHDTLPPAERDRAR